MTKSDIENRRQFIEYNRAVWSDLGGCIKVGFSRPSLLSFLVIGYDAEGKTWLIIWQRERQILFQRRVRYSTHNTDNTIQAIQ